MADVAVKICGLQSVEVLKSMINLPVDYIGFVFARSKRQVTTARAAELVPVLKEWKTGSIPQSVGVFVNPTWSELSEILKSAPLDIVQLHGTESPEFCQEVKERLGVKVFKACSVQNDGSLHGGLTMESYEGVIDGLLLDTYDPKYGGGSGMTFAWELAAPYKAWAGSNGILFLAAGGLHPDNVKDLLMTMGPDGVDVSSGVETNGVKDLIKMTAFVERVKGI
ncbi:phosphoribosylanthranilate isomerase [Fontibacillus solani]|uniref:N-(5'-phosphoribosyl)anthranilate isomerase n=1 Tax=Fontibacillus solani TaxID=1572857 RepID=A0A7W3SSM9_9BACL|nr:phosphoribosylanthranilate isomerase [Fontibacillus solani]MBA9085344.1 phosphoribosylanthranilate isomerase [Fontibacillus solani]